MLDLIETLKNEIKNKEKENLNPEKINQDAQQKVIVQDSDKIIDSALATHIHQLKVSINKELTTLSDNLEAEAEKYENLKNAIEIKEAELNESVKSAVEEIKERLAADFTQKEKLLQKGFEGEINVLTAKISAFETLFKEQNKQIEKLNLQQEKAYEKVQDIANKAVTGAAERLQNITVKTTPEKQS